VAILHNEAEYNQLVGVLDQLIDQVGEDETHPLASLMEVIGALITQYEDQHVPDING
jgi:HTH-type transcriptional regulator / antitoxin HigA